MDVKVKDEGGNNIKERQVKFKVKDVRKKRENKNGVF